MEKEKKVALRTRLEPLDPAVPEARETPGVLSSLSQNLSSHLL